MEQHAYQVSDLDAWLAQFGFERYSPILAENDVDLSVLPDLSESDLKELGFTLGDRKRFFRAVATLSDSAETTGNASSVVSVLHGAAERRQLTYGFCDLVGSTRLATEHDAEDMGQILQSYHACCQQLIERWGGQVLSIQGDGVSFCFGFPTAHEDDAERAVRAAMEIGEAVPELQVLPGLELGVRVGVATGRVVVGDVVGDGRQGSSVAGAVTSIPAKLQEFAPTNSVVISDTTQRLVSDAFELTFQGEEVLQERQSPVAIWKVEAALAVGRSFDDGHAGILVGRTKELAFLSARWQQALEGRGQTVLLSGEAGMGKTHLIHRFTSGIASAEMLQINLFNAAFHNNTTLFPVVSYMERAAGLTGRETRAERREKLAASLAPLEQIDPEASGIMGPLLGIEDTDSSSSFSGAQMKVRTLSLLQRYLVALSEEKPLLVILEDAHWCDPTTTEFFTSLISEGIDQNRIMLLITHRPDFEPPWPRSATLTPLRFERLDPKASADLVCALPAAAGLDDRVIDRIVKRADGVPLYLEELTKSVAEAGIEGASDPSSPDQSLSVPVSLADSLMARLDRLGTGKTVAQIASAIGRRFSHDMLSFVVDMDQKDVTRGLNELVGAELFTRQGMWRDAIYMFRHALVQEVAYGSLLKSELKGLHSKIAEVLQNFFPELNESEPELLAQHYVRAEMPGEAIAYLVEAGVRALTRAALVEAINHFSQAIELVTRQPHGPDRDREEVQLRVYLGGALIAAKGYAAPDVYETFLTAYELCRELDEPALMTSVLYGLWVVQLAKSDRAETTRYAQDLLSHAGTSADAADRLAANFADGITRFYNGNLSDSARCFGKVFDDYSTSLNPRLIQGFSDDLGQFARVQSAWLSTLQDDEAAALQHEKVAFEEAAALGDVMSEARANTFAMLCRHDRGDPAGTRQFAERAIEIASERVFPFWIALGQCGLGWAMAREGEAEKGVAAIEQGLGFFDLIEQKLPLTYWRSYLVEALLLAGDHERALSWANASIELARANVDSVFAPELLRLKSRAILAGSGDADLARQVLHEAIEHAAQSGAKLYSNNAKRDLANLS